MSLNPGINKLSTQIHFIIITIFLKLIYLFYFGYCTTRVLQSTHLIRKFRPRDLNSRGRKELPSHHEIGEDSDHE